MSYHIEINEYQRRLIMKALTSTDVNQFSQAPGSGDAFDNRGQRIRLPGTDVWYARPRRYRPGGLKLFSASKCDPARLRSNVSWWRPDCNDRPQQMPKAALHLQDLADARRGGPSFNRD